MDIATGKTASLYGSVPWVCEADRAQWEVETLGWTWRTSEGTIGLGRAPEPTKSGAERVAAKINGARIRQLEEHAKRYPEQLAECQRLASLVPAF